MYKKVIATILLIFSSACDLIDYHPYDGRLSISDRDINAANIKIIEEKTQNKDTIRFVLIGDTQRSYDETEDFVEDINKKDSIDFIIHGGDIADFGMTKEYEWTVKILDKLKVPYVAILGNHDVIGNGDEVYRKLYGNENFSFIAHDIKFVCLNTNAIEYDYSHPVPYFDYIKEQYQDTIGYKRTVVAMHAPPGCEQFDNNVKDVFQYYIKQFPNLMFCLHAHNHNLSASDIFGDGIIYYGCSNIAKRNYLLFTITPKGYTHEIINF
jgi:Icc-related predicted phosphoesterase